MPDFNAIEGNVFTKSESFNKKDSLAAVGTSPSTLALDVNTPSGVISSLSVVRTAGAPNEDFTVKIYDDVSKSADSLIFDATQTGADRLDVSRSELMRFQTADNNLYVELSTATTGGHTFSVRLQGKVVIILI